MSKIFEKIRIKSPGFCHVRAGSEKMILLLFDNRIFSTSDTFLLLPGSGKPHKRTHFICLQDLDFAGYCKDGDDRQRG